MSEVAKVEGATKHEIAPSARVRIVIYGSTHRESHLNFARDLARELLAFPEVVLLSGGFDGYTDPDRAKSMSVDRAVLSEVEAYVGANQEDLPRRFETWVPESEDAENVRRFRAGKVTPFVGTPQSRRFKLVLGADALISVGGKRNTAGVLELALALEKPVLPIAWTGGDSADVWSRHKDVIGSALDLDPMFLSRLETSPRSDEERRNFAADVARVIHRAAPRRCLVLMPYGQGHDEFYARTVRPAIVSAGFVPHRIDHDDSTGNIPELFRIALESARAILVDITGGNPNVMYELGHVHARGVRPLLIARQRPDAPSRIDLPFYLAQEKVVWAFGAERGDSLVAEEIGRHLRREASARRGLASA